MIVTNLSLYSFHKEIACYYFQSINEIMTLGVENRKSLIATSNLVGFWKIKQLKQQ